MKPLFKHALLAGATGGLGKELEKILIVEKILLTRSGRNSVVSKIELLCD